MKEPGRIAILGGGPIGLTCALLLAQRRISSVVVDARTLEEAQRDARLLALSRGTWQALSPLLAGHLPRHAPIRDVYVSSAGEFGTTHLAANDFDGTELGVTTLYGDLLTALARAAAAQTSIESRRPCRALRLEQAPDRVHIALDDATSVEAPLAVRAEGLLADNGGRDVDAKHWAVIANLRARGPTTDSAFERFTRDGPLALLPTPAQLGDGTAATLALVWCMSEEASTRRLTQPEKEFRDELQLEIGPRIAQIDAMGPRRRYALAQAVRENIREHRVIALGNAAQTLHPVAGQGFNLGVRDCVTLADALATHDNVNAALADYVARRRVDRAAIATLTRWLPDAFATRFAPIAAARTAALMALDLMPPLRRQLAHLLMFGARA